MNHASVIPEATMSMWLDATGKRRSRRAYTGERISEATLDRLAESCEGYRPYGDARVVLVREPAADAFVGIVGGYGKITGAPHLIVMIADDTSPTSQQHAGYVGEAAVLQATVLGLDTCWVGGFFDRRKVETMVDLGPTERVVAVSPAGKARATYSGSEHAMRTMAASSRRKPLEAIAPGSAEWSSWARSAAECARNAPSALNRQPWRLRLDGGSLVIARDSALEAPKVTKALDCGIAMLHAELGAFAAGIDGDWSDRTGGRDVAAFTPRPSDRPGV